MKEDKENKIKLVLVLVILIFIVFLYFYLKQNIEISNSITEPSGVEETTQTESITEDNSIYEQITMGDTETAPRDISDWEMQKPANTEPDTGETILVQ